MYEKQYLNAEGANKTKNQFECFIDSDVIKFVEEFSAFNIRNDRLHTFFRKWLHQNSKYSALWKVMIFVFTFSHEQFQIDNGFNINFD